ncbi:MAG: hypothetical protein HYU66_25075 [Armatimonadetes bacterium]|nr:hypothetical protein [Armatimonadota bacterium]
MNRTCLARGGLLGVQVVLFAATAGLADRDSDRRHYGGSWVGHGGSSRPDHGSFSRPDHGSFSRPSHGSFGGQSFSHSRPIGCDRPSFGFFSPSPFSYRPDPFFYVRADPWWDPFCVTLRDPWYDPYPRTVVIVQQPAPVRVVSPAQARVTASRPVLQRKLIHVRWETIGETVLVPLRETFAALGAQVVWDPDRLEGVVELSGRTVGVGAGAASLTVLGSGGSTSVKCDVGSVMVGSELYVPLQPMCSALGLSVRAHDGLVEVGDQHCLVRQ